MERAAADQLPFVSFWCSDALASGDHVGQAAAVVDPSHHSAGKAWDLTRQSTRMTTTRSRLHRFASGIWTALCGFVNPYGQGCRRRLLLLTKVLYSAFHGGDVLENEDVARAKIELDQLSAHCSDDDHLKEFVAGFGGLLLTAMKNHRPVTFT